MTTSKMRIADPTQQKKLWCKDESKWLKMMMSPTKNDSNDKHVKENACKKCNQRAAMAVIKSGKIDNHRSNVDGNAID